MLGVTERAQYKNWMFTINNPTENDDPKLWTEHVAFCVWQVERGAESATAATHYQGYLQLHKKKTLGGVRRLSSRAHWEPRRGTHQEAHDYCTKEDTRVEGPFTYGTACEKPGQRMDLLHFLHRSKETSELSLAEEYPLEWLKYHRAIERYRRLSTPNRSFKTRVTILYGPPGTGKSTWCRTNFPEAYWKNKSQWWDDYEGQKAVIIDEFYGWLPYDTLCRLCDAFPLLVETKGGHVNFVAEDIVFTSNAHPTEWYTSPNICWGAFVRRVERFMVKSDLDLPPVEETLPPERTIVTPYNNGVKVDHYKPTI